MTTSSPAYPGLTRLPSDDLRAIVTDPSLMLMADGDAVQRVARLLLAERQAAGRLHTA